MCEDANVDNQVPGFGTEAVPQNSNGEVPEFFAELESLRLKEEVETLEKEVEPETQWVIVGSHLKLTLKISLVNTDFTWLLVLGCHLSARRKCSVS